MWNTELCARAINPWLSPLEGMKYLPMAFFLSRPLSGGILVGFDSLAACVRVGDFDLDVLLIKEFKA